MKKYKIVYDVEGCISAAACVYEAPETWEMDEESNKATIKISSAVKTVGEEEVWIDEKDLEKNLAAARACPVKVIKIYDEEGNDIV